MWFALIAQAFAGIDWSTTGVLVGEERGEQVHTVSDLTGDGVGDVIVTGYDAAGDVYAELWQGGAALALHSAYSLGYGGFYYGFASDLTTGDFDGDGDRELVTGNALDGWTVSLTDAPGLVAVHDGGPGGPSPAPTWTAAGAPGERWGKHVAAADVDGDGYDDLLFTDFTDRTVHANRVYVAYGSPAGLGLPVQLWEDTVIGADLCRVAELGDVNGDGFGDFAVVGGYFYGASGDAFVDVWTGSVAGPVVASSYVEPVGSRDGFDVLAGGDVTGDGYDDVLISRSYWLYPGPSRSRLRLYFGGAAGLPAAPSWTWTAPGTDDAFATAGAIGDVDGDGFGDLAVGTPGALVDDGRVRIFHGAAAGPTISRVWTAPTPSGHFGGAVDLSADVTGDGVNDLLIGWPRYEAGGAATDDYGRAVLVNGPL